MDQDQVTTAPWAITTLVSCLPVLVLGMGTALAHMLREDAAAADRAQTDTPGPATRARPAERPAEQSGDQPDQNPPDRTAAEPCPPGPTTTPPRHDGHAGAEFLPPFLTLQSRLPTTPATSPATLPGQASASPGGRYAAEGSEARTRRLTP
jgi:hypothetical protein